MPSHIAVSILVNHKHDDFSKGYHFAESTKLLRLESKVGYLNNIDAIPLKVVLSAKRQTGYLGRCQHHTMGSYGHHFRDSISNSIHVFPDYTNKGSHWSRRC